MSRSRQIILVAVVLAAGGGLAAWLVTSGLGQEDGGDAPPGLEAALRVAPVETEVACSDGFVDVALYLDDLPVRAGPETNGANYGVGAFQVILRYDPAVLRLTDQPRIVFGPDLSAFDADGDGLTRTFVPVSDVDDYVGRAIVGAGSAVTHPGASREEGPDPVRLGRPLLLMTLRFKTVAAGTSAITISATDDDVHPAFGTSFVVDPDRGAYEPLVLEAGTVSVTGGGCPEAPPVTPRPTPGPTATLTLPENPPISTPQPVTPRPAAEAGRDDCPDGWAAYNDPDDYFSICYPPDWSAVTSPPQADLGTVLALRAPRQQESALVDPVSLTIYWDRSNAGRDGSAYDRCLPVAHWRDVHEEVLSLFARSAVACVGYETVHAPEIPDLPSMFVELAGDSGEGYAVLFVTQAVAIAESVADELAAVLASGRLAH